ncbi:MAG: flagellar basal body rod protein FlgC [Gammaproteobacteria bacterium]|jgi:flagellar basal-body rod protein FlgC
MALYNIFDIAGSAMTAQSVRLNTVASNLANADDVTGDAKSAYRARQPVFSAELQNAQGNPGQVGVQVDRIQESQAPVGRRYEPGNPLADKSGYVYTSNVNAVEQMADMISASRSYQNNVNVLTTTQRLLRNTLQLGK